MVSMMNDIDEDEISKKAFTTLTSMGEIAIDVVLGHIAALSIGLKGCVGLGQGLHPVEGAASLRPDVLRSIEEVAAAQEPIVEYYRQVSKDTEERRQWRNGDRGAEEAGAKASEWDVNDTGLNHAAMAAGQQQQLQQQRQQQQHEPQQHSPPQHHGGDHSHMAIVWGMLAKLLPVLNGMVYSDGDVREYVWRHGNGLAVLLHVVTRALPLELRVVTVYTLANLTQSHHESLQADAARLDAISVLAALMREVQRNDLSDSDDDGSLRGRSMQGNRGRRSDTLCVIMQVLHNLVLSNRENCSALVFQHSVAAAAAAADSGAESQHNLLEFISRCCVDGTEPDLRNEAAGVLLSVVEIAIEEGGQMMQHILAACLSTLKLLSESFDSSLTSALKARAQQSVRELEEASSADAGSKK